MSKNPIELAQKMMNAVDTKDANLLLNSIVIIITYAIDQGTSSKDLQVARETLETMKKNALGILEKGCGWKNYN
jgi:hypothetical protein